MINRSTWQSARDAMIADDRAKLGPPPTVDELLAYERGELSEEQATRVQQLLVAYPELARAYATPFPADDEPLPDDVLDRQWNAFRGSSPGPGARVLQFWRTSAAIAAAAAVVFATMLWQKQTNLMQPRVLPEHVLMSDGGRGAASHHVIRSTGEPVLLVVSINSANYETFRLELVNTASHRRIWSSEELRATGRDNTFDIEVPGNALTPGSYQVIAYGLLENAQEQIETFTIEVQPAR